VVGNFEDAVYAWRNFAQRWEDEAIGIILAAGGGAMGLRLGEANESASGVPLAEAALISGTGTVELAALEPDVPPGEEATARALQSTVGLVWRALLLWMLLLLLLSIAVWLG
jgi:adenosylcobinamide-phosphate synthase